MPRRDGTGPIGAGSMTGKGLGFCMNQNSAKISKDLIRSEVIDYAKANEMEESMLPARKK